MHPPLSLALPLLLTAPLAQSNTVPGLDATHAGGGLPIQNGHTGVHPTGTSAFAWDASVCNTGRAEIPWVDPDANCQTSCGGGEDCGLLEANQPVIAFLIARELDGRFEQISDYSYVKHGFAAQNASLCDTCQPPSTFMLGIGCADTYDHVTNGVDYFLAPAEEIDPWLGRWDIFRSHFDRGFPPAPFPKSSDGKRSLCDTSALGVLGSRVKVADADLDVAGARFFAQSYYCVRGEEEARRGDNLLAYEFVPSWNGSEWTSTAVLGGSSARTSVLELWDGADVASAADLPHDGRVFVGVNVLGPVAGRYRYEVAVHNRDANRKVGALRLPICADAQVTASGFGDLDDDPANDWSLERTAGELVFSTGEHPLRWNSVYHFWVETDAAPADGVVAYDPFEPGPGASRLSVPGLPTPTALFNASAGAGCSHGTPPALHATGHPPQATLGNASFGLAVTGNDPGAPVLALASTTPGVIDLGGCLLHLGGAFGAEIFVAGVSTANGSGDASLPLPVPAQPALEGVDVFLQALSVRAAGGPVDGTLDLSDALRVRVGDLVAGCP